MVYSADFETNNNENDCRVWAYALVNLNDLNDFIYGNNIDDFMYFLGYNQKINQAKNHTIYFHNAKFDCEFIMYWLFNHDFKHVTNRKFAESKTFTTLISDKGQFYSMTIYFEKNGKKTNKVVIYDSLKMLPFSVENIAKGFNLPISKLTINYNLIREINHKLTDEEIEYIRNDVTIVAIALSELFKQGLDKMTIASSAMANYKNMVTEKNFEKWFPSPEYDSDVRQSYKGGFTYLNPKFKNKIVGNGIVLDVNSLYPWVMDSCLLPYGEPIYFDGEYQQDELYPLYVQMFRCSFKLKKDFLPTIQLKNNFIFNPVEYVTDSENEEITLCLTNIDYELFLNHYDVFNIEFFNGWKFKGTTGLMSNYVSFWYNEKTNAKIDENYALYTISKLCLTSLYGKFASSPKVRGKIPYLEEDSKIIKYRLGDVEERKPIYIPIASFITSYARNKTITCAQLLFNRFIYADTDSLHLLGDNLPDNIKIDELELGAWKHELNFSKAKYIRAKTYIEYGKKPDSKKEEKLKVTCAGMPESCHQFVTFENFNEGMRYQGKLQTTHVKGGIVLKEIDFTIKKL